jgi:hypothetical protein
LAKGLFLKGDNMRMFRIKASRCVAMVGAVLAPSFVLAQNSLTYFNRPAIADYGIAPLETFSGDRDVLLLYAGGEVDRHSNLFALPDGVDPSSIYGSSARGDTVFKGLLGVSFDRQVSLQRYRLDASVLPVKYSEYSRFDYVGYSAGGHWDWAIGRPWFGTFGARVTSSQTPFGNYYVNAENLERRARIYASAGLRFTPSLGAFVGVDTETLDNSYTGVQAADYRFNSIETGLRFARGTGSEVDLVWRHTNGDYPNRQVTDEFGNLLPASVDNGFKQDSALIRLQIRPSNDSRIAGRVGYTERRFDNLSERNFSGPTAGINIDWKPSGAFTVRTELFRDIQSEDYLTASYVDRRTLRLNPSIQLTGKVSLFGQVELTKASYEGDPGYETTGAAVREDSIRIYGVGVAYEISRTISATLFYRNTERDSNYAAYDYTDRLVSANLLARF